MRARTRNICNCLLLLIAFRFATFAVILFLLFFGCLLLLLMVVELVFCVNLVIRELVQHTVWLLHAISVHCDQLWWLNNVSPLEFHSICSSISEERDTCTPPPPPHTMHETKRKRSRINRRRRRPRTIVTMRWTSWQFYQFKRNI